MDEAAKKQKAEQDALEQLKRRREMKKFMSAKVRPAEHAEPDACCHMLQRTTSSAAATSTSSRTRDIISCQTTKPGPPCAGAIKRQMHQCMLTQAPSSCTQQQIWPHTCPGACAWIQCLCTA
jgi:hypothetical protein